MNQVNIYRLLLIVISCCHKYKGDEVIFTSFNLHTRLTHEAIMTHKNKIDIFNKQGVYNLPKKNVWGMNYIKGMIWYKNISSIASIYYARYQYESWTL